MSDGGLSINVASIKTTVSFVVDKQSIAQARKAGDDLKNTLRKSQILRFVFRLKRKTDRKPVNKPMMRSLIALLRIRLK